MQKEMPGHLLRQAISEQEQDRLTRLTDVVRVHVLLRSVNRRSA